jgi:hypothetical protein
MVGRRRSSWQLLPGTSAPKQASTSGEWISGQPPLLKQQHEITREATGSSLRRHDGNNRISAVLLNPLLPFTTAKVLALKATVLLLLTLLFKARVQIATGSALGIFLLLVQTLVFLAISGGLVLAASAAALYTTQKRRPVGG